MSTLLIRLAAPMQSWGGGSRFTRRETMREPTKSGVTGLAAAALGRRREDSIADIAALRFGVRIDRPGQLLRDYHTAHKASFWQGRDTGGTAAFVSERYYLMDAVFLAGLEGDPILLREIDAAIQSPVFPLFLGRRSCPPEGRVSLGIRDCDLLTALCEEPWQGRARRADPPPLEIVYETEGGIITRDLPVSFSQTRRVYGLRGARRMQTVLADSASKDSTPTGSDGSEGPEEHLEHDAFAALGGEDCVSIQS